jgi:glutamate synthase (NADPH/NADH) large chain
VTNPPIDPMREALVMSLATAIGPDGNTFEETPEQCHRLSLKGPILTTEQLARMKGMREGDFEPRVLSMLRRARALWLERAVDAAVRSGRGGVDDGARRV